MLVWLHRDTPLMLCLNCNDHQRRRQAVHGMKAGTRVERALEAKLHVRWYMTVGLTLVQIPACARPPQDQGAYILNPRLLSQMLIRRRCGHRAIGIEFRQTRMPCNVTFEPVK